MGGRSSQAGQRVTLRPGSCRRGLLRSPQTPSPDLYSCARESVTKVSRHSGFVSRTLPGKLLGNDFRGGGWEWWPEYLHVILNTTHPAPLGGFSTT